MLVAKTASSPHPPQASKFHVSRSPTSPTPALFTLQANFHSFHSAIIMLVTTLSVLDMLSKVRRFLSFQMEKMTNVMIALASFLFAVGQAVNTSSHEVTRTESCRGHTMAMFRGAKTSDQTVRANEHCMRRWFSVSGSWRHNEQSGWLGSPRPCRRSAVQHLFWTASHPKNLKFSRCSYLRLTEKTNCRTDYNPAISSSFNIDYLLVSPLLWISGLAGSVFSLCFFHCQISVQWHPKSIPNS